MPGSRTSSAESRFLSLSGDLLWNILSRVETSDLATISCTCRCLDQIASSNEIWSRLCWQRWRSPNFSLIGLDKQSITQAAIATAEGNINRDPLVTCKTCARMEKCTISSAASTSRGTYCTTSPTVICTESHRTDFTAPKAPNDKRSRETNCTALYGTTGAGSHATTCTTSKVPRGTGLPETSCKDSPGTNRTGSIGSSCTEFMLLQEAPPAAACRANLTCDVSHNERREHQKVRGQDSSLPERTAFNSPKQQLGSTRTPDMQPERTSFRSYVHAALNCLDVLPEGHPTSHCMDTQGNGQGRDVRCMWDAACASNASDVGHIIRLAKDTVKVSDVKDAVNVGNMRDANDIRLVRDVNDVKDAEHIRDVRDAHDIRLVRDVIDVKDAKHVRDVRDANDIRLVRDVQHVKDPEHVRDVRDAQDMRLVRDVKDVKGAENITDLRDVGVVKDADDVVDMRDVKDVRAVRDVGQVIDAVVGIMNEDADLNLRNAADVGAARNATGVGILRVVGDVRHARNVGDAGGSGNAVNARDVGNVTGDRDVDVGHSRNVGGAGGSGNAVNARDVGNVTGDRDADNEEYLKDVCGVGDVRNSVDAVDVRNSVDAVDVRNSVDATGVRDSGAKRLFCSSNGWHNAGLKLRELKPDGDFVCALHCSQLPEGSLSIACAKSSTLEVWNLKPWSGAPSCSHHGNEGDTHVTCEVPQDHFSVYSIVQHAPGRFIAGNSIGSLLFFELDNSTLSHVHTHSLPIPTSPIVDLYVNPTSSHLASLHDSTFCMSPVDTPRNCLKWFDVNTCTELGRFTDCMDSYEVMCMCPSRGASGGVQLVAGSVHGEFCVACYKSGIPSLCQHKPQAQSAALCVFDLRAQCAMVQRYSLHQRSLYPVMRSARDHYLFTSHAGQPLGVWDRRWMSMPVFTQEHLGNFPMPHVIEGLPLPGPSRPSAHQGLWLDCDDDVLIGRAENGMIWMWDLSNMLGWARDSHKPQPWMTSGQSPNSSTGAESSGDDSRSVWAVPLGALPCETSLPITWAPNVTSTATIVCQVASSVDSVDKVVVGCLSSRQ